MNFQGVVLSLVLVSSFLIVSSSSYACGKGKHGEKRFEKLDTNQDNKISKKEMEDIKNKMATKKFERMDTNKDGKVTLSELQDKNVGHINERFEKSDTNKDGFLTTDEMKKHQSHDHPKKDSQGMYLNPSVTKIDHVS